MDLVNETKVPADWMMGLDRDGRELVIVMVKATFVVPENGKESMLAEEQVPLTQVDTFTGEPGLSAPLCESDYAHRKPRCDVLLIGSAYAPGGRPTDRVTVSLQVGSLQKSFDVVGNRAWKSGILLVGATHPEPFTVMPISYNNAFGGVDRSQDDPLKHRWYPTNHAGVGFHDCLDPQFIDGKPLPNTEETGKKVTNPHGIYKPMAFGPVAGNWQPRIKYAGTYDQKWLDEKAPLWPDDFDDRFFQAAPEDQQIPHPRGGEEVVLKNLTPQGLARFPLPKVSWPVVLIPHNTLERQVNPVVDTVLIEPDKQRFSLTWRLTVPMKRSSFDMRQIVVGKTMRAVRREREGVEKTHYANLDLFIKAQRPK